MRVVIQRVSEAAVRVDGQIVGQINQGLLVLLGIETADTEEDVDWLVNKTLNLRIFNDAEWGHEHLFARRQGWPIGH